MSSLDELKRFLQGCVVGCVVAVILILGAPPLMRTVMTMFERWDREKQEALSLELANTHEGTGEIVSKDSRRLIKVAPMQQGGSVYFLQIKVQDKRGWIGVSGREYGAYKLGGVVHVKYVEFPGKTDLWIKSMDGFNSYYLP